MSNSPSLKYVKSLRLALGVAFPGCAADARQQAAGVGGVAPIWLAVRACQIRLLHQAHLDLQGDNECSDGKDRNDIGY